jgi:thiol-disulfide isomerase/thioredoxin
MALRIIISLLFPLFIYGQTVTGIYKINDLVSRIKNPDTVYVVNFWATWCKPCIKELPAFDSLESSSQNSKIKVLLVSMDFKEDNSKKVESFLRKNRIRPECIILDEIDGNSFINKISPQWSGALPATLFKKGKARKMIEKQMTLKELQKFIRELKNPGK